MKSPPRKVTRTLVKSAVGTRLTIVELAERTGLAVRHLRELQTRGTLEPPVLVGRKGFYNERHLARVALVRRLQGRGYSLSAISDLLKSWREGAGIDVVLGLEEAVTDLPAEPALGSSESRIERLYPELIRDPALLEAALQAGLVRRDRGKLTAPSDELLALGRSFIDAGLSTASMIAELARLREDTLRIAARLRENFVREVLLPLQQQGMPAARMPALAQAVLTMRPAAARAVYLLMNQALYADPPPASAKPTLGKRATKGAKTAGKQAAPGKPKRKSQKRGLSR